LPFDLAVLLFDGDVLELDDLRRDYGELRTKAIGQVNGVVMACVYTRRAKVIRIISLRVASRKERDGYSAQIASRT
jgi:uncharacterized DUF497 family protein